MKMDSRAVHVVFWGFLGLVIASIAGVFVSSLLWVKSPPALPVFGELPEFKLTNQLGQAFARADLRGKVVVADIIFTRCPGPCLDMTRKMKAIERGLPPGHAVKLVSLTADPEYDTPAVLKEYAARFQANNADWQFLTGPKSAVYSLAAQGLKLAVQDNPQHKPDENEFIHSTRLILIDQQGRLRGAPFDGTEMQTISDVLGAVQQLLKEG